MNWIDWMDEEMLEKKKTYNHMPLSNGLNYSNVKYVKRIDLSCMCYVLCASLFVGDEWIEYFTNLFFFIIDIINEAKHWHGTDGEKK